MFAVGTTNIKFAVMKGNGVVAIEIVHNIIVQILKNVSMEIKSKDEKYILKCLTIEFPVGTIIKKDDTFGIILSKPLSKEKNIKKNLNHYFFKLFWINNHIYSTHYGAYGLKFAEWTIVFTP